MLSPALYAPLFALGTFQPAVATEWVTPHGHPAIQAGVLSEPLGAPLADAVHHFAQERAPSLGVPPSSTLAPPRAFGTRFGAAFHMAQLVGGVEVEGARVVVTVNRLRQVKLVTSSVVPYARAHTDWKLTARDAKDVASAAVDWSLRAQDGRAYGGTVQRMFRVGDEVRAGYLVWVPTLDLRDNWYVAVDAGSGEVLFRQNRAFRNAAHEADVYASSPGGLDLGVGVAPVSRVVLDRFKPSFAGGLLDGEQVQTFNCCPNEGCSTAPGAGPKRAQGTTNGFGFPVSYDVAICDRMPRASNDLAVSPSGNFVFEPVDVPGGATTASQASATDSDLFAEVHAYWHVNAAYDYIRGLSTSASPLFPNEDIPPFQMRDTARGERPAVWVNVVIPDQNEMYSSLFSTGTAVANSLMRVDNAAFMARENFQSLLIPELFLDVDALMIFQGSQADFAYDAPVLWHEFGHGVIHSTAAFSSFTLDGRSGNNEGGALHEGLADFFAAAFGQHPLVGEYVGPRMASMTGEEGALRSLDNDAQCPDILWGEVHQDSRHFAGALWEARSELFQGQDAGRTFDAAIYAALVAMTPTTSFEQAAHIIIAHVAEAFSNMPSAEASMQAVFVGRGVLECSKVLDVTGVTEPRRYFGIGGSQAAGVGQGQIVPGPYQFKISAPNGAQRLTVRAEIGGGGFGGQPQARLLARFLAPVNFTRTGSQLTHDADVVGSFAPAQGAHVASVEVEVPCNAGDLYFALGAASPGGETLQNVTWTVEERTDCPEVPDAGTGGVDAGTGDGGEPPNVPAIPNGQSGGRDVGKVGCGCGVVDPSAALFGLFALAGLGRLRRRRAS